MTLCMWEKFLLATGIVIMTHEGGKSVDCHITGWFSWIQHQKVGLSVHMHACNINLLFQVTGLSRTLE
jgi:hypothetical protein